MLELLYDKTNNEVRGWCADSEQFGNFRPKRNEELIFLDIELKDIPAGKKYKFVKGKLIPTRLPEPEPEDLRLKVKELEAKVADYEQLKSRLDSLEKVRR